MAVKFDYGVRPIKDFSVEVAKGKKGKSIAKAIVLDGERLLPTKRTWQSFQMRFRVNTNVVKYFPYGELFNRISQVAPNDKVRYCIERVDGHPARMLALTNPNSVHIPYGSLTHIINEHGYEGVNYSEGFVRSTHKPKMLTQFDIAGDTFENRFIIDTPIDGFGRPAVYLSMLRQICSNGAVGYAPAFRSELAVGKKNDSIEFSLIRALDGFNNEEGYSALRQRFESAANSYASVNEAMTLQRTVLRLYNTGQLKGITKMVIGNSEYGEKEMDAIYSSSPVMKQLLKTVGNLNKEYGLSNIDALSTKRQRTLPAPCYVYDLLNFASEVATHHAVPSGGRSLQAFVGTIISGEYDLEGTGSHYKNWKDIFIDNNSTADTLASMHSLTHD